VIDAKLTWNPSSKLSTFVRFRLNNGDRHNPEKFGLLGGPVVSPTNISAGVGGATVYNNTASVSNIFNSHLYQTSSNCFITNAGGFHFAQGRTLLQGGPAGK
jgi:hypothetical protein